MNEDRPNWGNPSGKPCVHCQAEEAYLMPHPPRTEEGAISICEECPYAQCLGCGTAYTIDAAVGLCKCNHREFCPSCRDEKSNVSCPRCAKWSLAVCSRPECTLSAQDYFRYMEEICSCCEVNSHCAHPFIITKGEKPEDPVYCCFETGPFETGSKATCSKWICPQCRFHSFIEDKGFLCKTHFALLSV